MKLLSDLMSMVIGMLLVYDLMSTVIGMFLVCDLMSMVIDLYVIRVRLSNGTINSAVLPNQKCEIEKGFLQRRRRLRTR